MRQLAIAILLLGAAACSDDDAGAGGGEVCGNLVDDDRDGFLDCADQDCWRAPGCADAAVGDTSDPADADASAPRDETTVAPDATSADTTASLDVPDVSGPACDPCSDKGSVKGRVCAPSEQVYVNDASVVVSGTGCDGEPFTLETRSGHDGTYYLLDVPCGTHTITIEKGSFSAIYAIPVVAGQLTDVTGAANKLCLQASQTRIAVMAGSWDDLGSLVGQLGFDYDLYTEEIVPGADGTIVELLADSGKLESYDIVFANCGAHHGWMPQEHPEVMANVKDFVLQGGSLYMSDYAWVYGEWSFPDAIEWLASDDVGDMYTPDSPQAIESGTTVKATIVDGALASVLGRNTIDIVFDKGPQIAAIGVGAGAFAHAVGDVPVPSGFGYTTLDGAPLAVSYVPAQGAGRVIYTNFHNDEQATADMLVILRYLVFTL